MIKINVASIFLLKLTKHFVPMVFSQKFTKLAAFWGKVFFLQR
jgi:hypothetical protein